MPLTGKEPPDQGGGNVSLQQKGRAQPTAEKASADEDVDLELELELERVPRGPLIFANEVLCQELEQLLTDARSAMRASLPTTESGAVAAIMVALEAARHELLASGKRRWWRPWRSRAARVHARYVARRCRGELYLYVSEARVRAHLPRLRHEVQAAFPPHDARTQAYLGALDRLSSPAASRAVEPGP